MYFKSKKPASLLAGFLSGAASLAAVYDPGALPADSF